jgi:hypothetical protein
MVEFLASYICAGFYPLTAHDLIHAASLFALWEARRRFGAGGRCDEPVLQEEIADGARFEARLLACNEPQSETYRFTVTREVV